MLCCWLGICKLDGMQDEASQAEHRLRELNKTRLRLEKQAEGSNEEMLAMEAQLEERLSSLPAQTQQEYVDLQNEVRRRLQRTQLRC